MRAREPETNTKGKTMETTTAKKMDHTAYPKMCRTISDAELRYIISDCRAALAAMPNGENAGYYADEINYAAAELNRRK